MKNRFLLIIMLILSMLIMAAPLTITATSKPLVLKGKVTTFAGAINGTDGSGSIANFNSPQGLTSDGTNLYVSDTANCIIRKIVISTAVVSTFAGSAGAAGSLDGKGTEARFNKPEAITTDGINLYVIDTYDDTIRKIVIETGVVSTIVDSKIGSNKFGCLKGIATDGTNLYVTDSEYCKIIKVVIATGKITTIAEPGLNGYEIETTRFSDVSGIVTDGTNLYVSDTSNHTIRKIVIATGNVTTIAGSRFVGWDDGNGTEARFNRPIGLATDGTNLYVADTYNYSIRKIVIATGSVTTISSFDTEGSAEGTGTAGLVIDGAQLFVTDLRNNTIRKIDMATGVQTTFAGSGTKGNVDGKVTAARFFTPRGLTTDGTNLYIADTDNHIIRKIDIKTGDVSTIAGSGIQGNIDGNGINTMFDRPMGLTSDGKNIYVSDTFNHTIRKINIATGVVSTIAGSNGEKGSVDGKGTAARFYYPLSLATDGTNLFVVDAGADTIRKIVLETGIVSTIAGSASINGNEDGNELHSKFDSLYGITTDGINLYVTDYNSIRKVDIATGYISTIVGVADQPRWQDGTLFARFNTPGEITTDGTNLYVVDIDNNAIRKIVIETGVVSTIAGYGYKSGWVDGIGGDARFYNPSGIAILGSNLYVADTKNNTIRKIE